MSSAVGLRNIGGRSLGCFGLGGKEVVHSLREYRVEATRGKILKLGFVAYGIPRGSSLEEVSKPGGYSRGKPGLEVCIWK